MDWTAEDRKWMLLALDQVLFPAIRYMKILVRTFESCNSSIMHDLLGPAG